MLKINKQDGRLVTLGRSTVGALTERYDLGQLVVSSADEFFGEIGQRLFVVGKTKTATSRCCMTTWSARAKLTT